MIHTQKDRIKYLLIGLICSLLSVKEVIGKEKQCSEVIGEKKQCVERSSFEYRPPKRGAPPGRVGGGTRSINLAPPVLVLAPNHIGYTSQSQPRLYWYVSERSKFKTQLFELTNNDSGVDEFTAHLPIQNNGGIHSIDLAKYDVHLKRNASYTWKVFFLDSSNEKLSKLLSGGYIQFVGKNQKLINATPRQLPYLAAKLGLWYDALDGFSVLIESESDANYWISQRADLLEQGELETLAIIERLKINANR